MSSYTSLKQWLAYNPLTGEFTWLRSPVARIPPGTPAGYQRGRYTQIRFKGTLFYAHRLAYLFMRDSFPDQEVDHINGNGNDNRWVNLRLVDKQGNQRNTVIPRSNTSGVIGVAWRANRATWTARIMVAGKTKYLGEFKEFDAAVAARKAAEVIYNFHPNHGRSAA